MDSNTPLWPDTLPVPLLKRQHRFFPRPQVVMMESGRLRKRRFFDRTAELIDVQWSFTLDEYEKFEEFFRDTIENGSLGFSMTTLEWTVDSLEVPTEITRELAFWESNYSFARSDNLFAVSATLEVVPLDTGPEPLPANACAVEYTDETTVGGGDKFDCYALENDLTATVLSAGTYFDGAWVYRAYEQTGTVFTDSFESYLLEQDVTSTELIGGRGFSEAWVYGGGLDNLAYDMFETYEDGTTPTDSEPMSEGVGWAGAWRGE